jgi:hypothetical protein
MALGGSYASGTDSFAAAIANNTSTYGATGANSVAIGKIAKSNGSGGIAIGNSSLASGSESVAIGSGCAATGQTSCAIGYSVISSQFNQVIIGTNGTTTSANGSKIIFATDVLLSSFSAALSGKYVRGTQTTNNTPTKLRDSGGWDVILPNNSTYAFTGTIVAQQSKAQGSATAAWKVEGLITRGANAASTTLVASTVTAISNAPAWTLALSADTTNGGLAVTFTGAASTYIRTVATIETVEVTYA